MPPRKASAESKPKPPRRAVKQGQLNRTRDAVIKAAGKILMKEGYRALRIERIVSESGVGRTTIYRRFGNTDQIAMDAFNELLGPPPRSPDTGSVREDLIQLHRKLVRALKGSAWGATVPAVVEAAVRNKKFAQLLHGMIEQRRSTTREILDRGIARGELPADTKIDWLLDITNGPIYYRALISGKSIEEDGFIEHLVDAAILGALRRGAK